ncbi:MAG: C40 family peptidase, partial [Butyrivibrio sp.]|nr:C40 family peptidase [Butyrivibrio sp.]
EDQNKDESSVAEEAFEAGGYVASGAVSHVTSKVKNSKYSNKLHQGKDAEGAAEKAAKEKMKKEMQRKAAAKNAKAAENTGKIGRKITDKAEDMVGILAEKIQEFVKDNPVISLIIVAILILVLVFSGMMNSCSALGAGGGNITVATSFTAKDEDILAVEDDYKELEEGLMDEVDEIAEDHADYDEINYHLDEVGHNPYQLAAILTVIFESYTRDEVQAKLQEIFNLQYEVSYEETVETREREVEDTRWVEDDSYAEGGYWEDYTYTEEYEYYICDIYLVNHGLDHVVEELGFTDDEMARYEVLLETFGNKKYLFGEDDIYGIPGPRPGDYDDYHVPGEYLTDEEFARMLHEAERYLGVPYVWGGYDPEGFDCSGFVSYVINHCGNGWNVGRQTANGLRAITSNVPASEAKPGDLVFFQGTYDTPGASHVGIYVGNGMMIHAGNPVHYSSINTPYWQSHYLGFGRMP